VCTLVNAIFIFFFASFWFFMSYIFRAGDTETTSSTFFHSKICRKTMTKFILVFAVLESETKVKHLGNKSNNKQLLLTTLLLLLYL